MVNYRVDDLHALVKALREEGCNVLEKIDESEYGMFAWNLLGAAEAWLGVDHPALQAELPE